MRPGKRSLFRIRFLFQYGHYDNGLPSKDARVLKDCLLLCDDYEKKLSRTLQGSDIYRLNHSGGVPVTVSEDTAYLLGQACKYAELSGGRIDPTVAPLMDLWNFTGQAADKNAQKKDTGGCRYPGSSSSY